MTTKEQILRAEGEELSRLLGEAFGNNHRKITEWCNVCMVCQASTRKVDTCPITLTWNEAMKWRDWAVKKFGYCMFTDVVLIARRGTYPDFIAFAKPEHYLKAAAICKLNAERK